MLAARRRAGLLVHVLNRHRNEVGIVIGPCSTAWAWGTGFDRVVRGPARREMLGSCFVCLARAMDCWVKK